MDLAGRKRTLRRTMSEQRRRLRGSERRDAERAVASALLQMPEFSSASTLALYAALEDEVPTREFFDAAATKRTLFPRCAGNARLEFVEVEHWEELRPGRYGVLEPPPDRGVVCLGRRDLVLMPGVAFDLRGRRLGRGKGYYDRTFPPELKELPHLFGVAFAFQVVDEVPVGPLDRCVDAVVCEDGVHRTGAEETRS